MRITRSSYIQMNIWNVIFSLVSLVLADTANIEALIAARNWAGLTANLAQLVEEAVAQLQSKA